MKRTYYEILGITQAAPQEIITAVYRTWMYALKMHPDLGGDESLAKEINAAYDILKDPERRAKYNSKMLKKQKASFSTEHRRAPRFRVNAEIAVMLQGDEDWRRALTLDASAMGLRVKSSFFVEIGTHVTVAFEGSVSEAIESHVKWSKELADDQFEFGIEFFSPVPDILKRLAA
ncbi:MAG: DnaJ domain-containing protein [Deltaproteobacteria bacterium]|jgi:curved DNA-binding protein CbpA|nr:DnaJ domain-containing protein [Deltaproteobacteria bacterium]